MLLQLLIYDLPRDQTALCKLEINYMTISQPSLPNFKRSQLLWLIVLALAVFLIGPQLNGFRGSFALLKHPNWLLTGLALLATGLGYASAGGTYFFLSLKPLSYARTVLVQFASMFVNRLLPGGLGALGANYAYLRHQGLQPTAAGTVVALNNTAGLAGHLLLLGFLFFIAGVPHPIFQSHLPHFSVWYIGAVGIIVFALILVGYKRINQTLVSVMHQTLLYRYQPARLFGALVSSMSLTAANTLSLWLCADALAIHLSLAAVLLIFSFGITLGTAVPTPGGLGGVEAGLVAGFVAYGVHSETALAVALLYRLISYWLMLAIGGIAFIYCQRRGYFTAKYSRPLPRKAQQA